MRIEMYAKPESAAVSEEMMRKIASVLQYAAKMEKISPEYTVTLSFTDDETIWKINRRFRDTDRSTDVLSFPLTQGETQREEEISLYKGNYRPSLGDIIISRDHMEAQAEEYGHGTERECCFLALHGLLHLLGYDHMTEEEAGIMEARANRYLEALGITR